MKEIHRYLGLLLSGILLVISVTGVMLVWKREYLWVTIPAARELPAAANENALSIAAGEILSSYPAGEVLFVRFYSERLSIHKVFLSSRRYAWHDQYGAQLQVWSGGERYEDWLLDLHHRLLLGNNIGLNAVGITGLLLILTAILGVFLWWPWRSAFSANIVPVSGKREHIRKSHAETGTTIFVPALVMLISGVILIYPTGSRILLRDGFADPQPPLMHTFEMPYQTSNLDWQTAIGLVQTQFPEGKVQWLSYPTPDSNAFTIGVQQQNSWNRMGSSSVRFTDENTMLVKRQSEQTKTNQALDYVYPIHGGKFSNLYRLALSATGVLMAWLSFLALVSYSKRRRKS